MNTDKHRFLRTALLPSVFIGVHLWLTPLSFAQNFEKRWLSGVFYGEGANFGDFNMDGKLDVVSGPYIYDGPEFTVKREFMPREPSDPLHYSKNFFAYAHDFTKDGYDDIVIIGFPGQETFWYENPGAAASEAAKEVKHWKQHLVLKVTDNESPVLANVVGAPPDTTPELVCMSGGHLGYASVDPADPTTPWKFTAVSPKVGDYQRFTHGLGVGDVNGDKKLDLLEKNGWWEQPASADGASDDAAAGPASAGPWKLHEYKFSGPGGAQMYAYDVDGDGDNDVITSLHAHGYGLAWYEHVKDGDEIDFKQHLILSPKPEEKLNDVQFSQLHAVELVDIDGDGLKDILTGKRYWAHGPTGDPDPEGAPVLYWFKLSRDGGKAKYEPRKIDAASGVGTMVATGDANGDKKPDIIVGNKRGTILFLSK